MASCHNNKRHSCPHLRPNPLRHRNEDIKVLFFSFSSYVVSLCANFNSNSRDFKIEADIRKEKSASIHLILQNLVLYF